MPRKIKNQQLFITVGSMFLFPNLRKAQEATLHDPRLIPAPV